MTAVIRDCTALDIDVHLTGDGDAAVLSLVTDDGPVAIQCSRDRLEALAARIQRELAKPPPSKRRTEPPA